MNGDNFYGDSSYDQFYIFEFRNESGVMRGFQKGMTLGGRTSRSV